MSRETSGSTLSRPSPRRVILMAGAECRCHARGRAYVRVKQEEFSACWTNFVAPLKCESGQTMAEYAVVLGVITIAVVVTLGLLSTAISRTLNNVIASL